MRMVWSGAPADEFMPVRDQLVRWFGAWARRHDRIVHGSVVEALLHDRWALGDGLLSRWEPDDFAEQFLVRFPRHVTAPTEELPAMVMTARAFVDFLFDEELADARCTDRAELHAAIAELEGTFVAAMGDESMFGLTKFWTARMVAEGVDPTGVDAAAAFVDAVQDGRIAIDDDVFDQVVANHLDDEIELPPRMPLILLPDPDETRATADKSAVVQRIRALTEWAGKGRPLTEAPEDELLLRWARETRVVREVKGKLVQVRAAATIVADPMALAQGAFEAFFEMGETICGPAGSVVRAAFDDAVLALVMALYAHDGALLREDAEELMYAVAETATDPDEEPVRADADADTGRTLDALDLLGAVEIDGPDVLLTPLGTVLTARHLREHGVHVPTIGELSDETAEVVIAAAAEAGPGEREALMAAWTAKNQDARQELLALIKRTDDRMHQALAEGYAAS